MQLCYISTKIDYHTYIKHNLLDLRYAHILTSKCKEKRPPRRTSNRCEDNTMDLS